VKLYRLEQAPAKVREIAWKAQTRLTARYRALIARGKKTTVVYIAANARRGKNLAPISAIALEAVKRIDPIFDVERDINGGSAGSGCGCGARRRHPSFSR
jgi:hypothetical protein